MSTPRLYHAYVQVEVMILSHDGEEPTEDFLMECVREELDETDVGLNLVDEIDLPPSWGLDEYVYQYGNVEDGGITVEEAVHRAGLDTEEPS